MTGTLYVVATPIGNLQDISLRALDVLKTADIVACEDTRHTGRLLSHFGIKNKLVSYHEHNESSRAPELADWLTKGKTVALVSDAGMPGISDPGFELINVARQAGSNITIVPGPTAFVTAAVLSGLPSDSIYFGGFLPSRSGARKKALNAVSELQATLVFYESTRRLAASLADCLSVLGPRRAAVVREITKIHEETMCGDLKTLAKRVAETAVKGEVVILIDRTKAESQALSEDRESALADLYSRYVDEGIDRKAALKRAAKECGYPKSEAYRIVMGKD